MNHDPFSNETRSEKRRSFEVTAVAYKSDGKRVPVKLSELSYEGCRLSASDQFEAGEQLTLVIVEFGTEIDATVRWVAPGSLGLRFTPGALQSHEPLISSTGAAL